MPKDKTILLGVTGGISSYKTCDLASKLCQKGADVNVIMTSSAKEFISPLTFSSMTGNPVYSGLFDLDKSIAHIDLAEKADVIVVAPATANIISKMAHGIADDLLSTVLLAFTKKIILAPAMNQNMYANAFFQENLNKLIKHGVIIVGPEEGALACGLQGKGRMADTENIISAVEGVFHLNKKDMQGKKLLITAGGTKESIDPVRFIGNRSSGKMGYALANTAVKRGAEVTLITTVSLDSEPNINKIFVETADQMYHRISCYKNDKDIIVMAAAVADFKPVGTHKEKLKKSSTENYYLELEKTTDILELLGKQKEKNQIIVGFAAETENIRENALDKLYSKNIDIIIANDVSREDRGFESDYNAVTVYDIRGESEEIPLMSKQKAANIILDYVMKYYSKGVEFSD